MKLKVMPMLAGAIALALSATPLAVLAQSSQIQPPPPSQQSPNQTPNRSPLAGIELTQQQKDQMAQIRSDTNTQLNKILTPDQQNKLKAAVQAGQDPRAAIGLSDQQKAQLRTLLQSAQSRAEAVLTPQQRQQLQKNTQLRQQGQSQ